MSIIYGTREVATIGTSKHVEIAYPVAARESLLDTPTVLTDSYPVDPHAAYTVLAGDLPTVAGTSSYTYSGVAYVAGHNLDDPGLITITPLVHKNGVEISTGNGFNASGGACWTMNIYLLGALVAGDVLEVWLKVGVGENADVDYTAFAALAIRPMDGDAGQVLLNAQYQAPGQYPSFVLADPRVENYFSAYVSIANNAAHVDNGGPFPTLALGSGDDRALYRFAIVDVTSDIAVYSGSERPRYNAFFPPTDITFTPTSIRVV